MQLRFVTTSLALTLTLAGAAYASPPQIFTVAGNTVFTATAPANDTTAVASNTTATLFLEKQSVVVTAPLNYKVYVGTLASTTSSETTAPTKITLTVGQVLDSALLVSDHAGTGGSKAYSGSVTLSEGHIIGLIFESSSLDKTDSIFGVPSTTYDNGDGSRDLETSGTEHDNFSLSGNTLTYSFNTGGSPDEVRILYVTPEPATTTAFIIGFLGLSGLILRKRRHFTVPF
jgi:hypothetical protein